MSRRRHAAGDPADFRRLAHHAQNYEWRM